MSSIEDFLSVAEERKVRYALLGALAVSAIRPFRTTHDVDVAVHPADLWKLKNKDCRTWATCYLRTPASESSNSSTG